MATLNSLQVKVGADITELQKKLQKVPQMVEKYLGDDAIKALSKGSSGFRNFASNAASKIGGFLAGAGAKLLKWGSIAASTISGIVIGLGLKGGIARALETETARVQLERMGYSLKQVDKLVDTVSDTFDGTVFTTPEGFSLTQKLLGVGVALDDIPRRLTGIADLAAHANADIDRIGEIFVKTSASGRLMAYELNQISMAGIALEPIANTLGMTSAEMRSLASSGELTAEMFWDAVEATEMYAGAAKASGNTTAGAFKNVRSQFARLFEIIVNPLFGPGGPLVTFFQAVRQALIDTRPVAASFGEVVAAKVVPRIEALSRWVEGGGIQRGIEWLTNQFRRLTGVVGGSEGLWSRVVGWFRNFRDSIASGDAPLQNAVTGLMLLGGPLMMLAREILPALLPLLPTLIAPLAELADQVVPLVAQGLGLLIEHTLPGLVKILEAAIAWLGAGDGGLVKVLAIAGVAFKLFTAIVSVNPFVAIGTAVVVIASLIITNWDNITAFLKRVWDWIRNTAGSIWDKIVGAFSAVAATVTNLWNTFLGFIQGIPGKIGGFFSGIADIVSAPFRTAFNRIADVWNNTVGKLSWTVPSWVPGIGGNTISAPKIPKFHTGGIVPGRPGEEVIIKALAGERVSSRASSATSGAPQVIQLSLDGKVFYEAMVGQQNRDRLRNTTPRLAS